MCGNYGCYSNTIWLIIFSENTCVKSMGVIPTQNGSLYFQKIHCGIYGCYSYSIWLITFPENTCVETMGVILTQYGSLYFQKIHVWNLCVLFLHNMTHYISRKYMCGIYGCYSYTLRLIIFPERVAVLTIISLTLGRLYQVGWRHQHKATPTMINIKSRDNNLLPFCVLLFEDQSTQHTEQGVSKPLHLPLTISFDAMKCFSSNSLKYNRNNHYKSEATVSKWLAIYMVASQSRRTSKENWHALPGRSKSKLCTRKEPGKYGFRCYIDYITHKVPTGIQKKRAQYIQYTLWPEKKSPSLNIILWMKDIFLITSSHHVEA